MWIVETIGGMGCLIIVVAFFAAFVWVPVHGIVTAAIYSPSPITWTIPTVAIALLMVWGVGRMMR